MTALEFNELKRGSGEAQGVQRIAQAISNLDATSELYDEAVELAREGSLAKARDRLRMLLCLDPHDGQGHLLLAKVFGAQSRWTDALSELDQASACGLRVPEGLRETFENKRDASQRSRSEKVVARTTTELLALREEARRLRAENNRLERESREMGDKARLWMSTTAVVSGLGLFALLVAAVFGGSADDVEPVEEALTQVPIEVPVELPIDGPTTATTTVTTGALAPEPELAAVTEPVVQPRTYTVTKGDNLGAISKKVYGTTTRWQDIRDANAAVLGGGIALQVGMELTLPD